MRFLQRDIGNHIDRGEKAQVCRKVMLDIHRRFLRVEGVLVVCKIVERRR